MELQLSAILERGDKYFIASCPEFPEANGQGSTRDEALQDLSVSIQSILEFRREEALAQASPGAERTSVVVP
jgi:predicted RNase H-like HicB family nuclease